MISSYRASWWAAACVSAAGVSATWWVSAAGLYHGPDHMVGPYAVPLTLEYGVGIACFAAGIAAAVVTAVGRHRQSGVSVAALVLLMLAAVVATGCWRVITAGVDGANIGVGLIAGAGPLAVAALVFASVVCERRSRGRGLRGYPLNAALAWMTGPVLFLIIWVLSR